MIAVDRRTAMETKSKERLHRLVDALPAGELLAAERYLQFLSANRDPLVQALMDAPEDPEPLSDADRQALEEGRHALEAGDTVSDDEFCTELKI